MPNIPAGATTSIPQTGISALTFPNVWEIWYSGSIIATNTSAGGWFVAFDSGIAGNWFITVPSGATLSTGSLYQFRATSGHSGPFDVVAGGDVIHYPAAPTVGYINKIFACQLSGTVGYTLSNADGVAVRARSTTLVSLGNNNYDVVVQVPTNWQGVLVFDNGTTYQQPIPVDTLDQYKVDDIKTKVDAYLDAAISSVSTYAGGDTAGTTTLLARLTGTRAGNLDNLDGSISGLPTATAVRTEMDSNSTKLAAINAVTTQFSFDATTMNVNSHIDNPTSVVATTIAAEVVTEMAAYTPGFNINMSQVVGLSPAAGTIERCLQVSRARAIGKWTINLSTNTEVLYDCDNSTVVQSWDLTPHATDPFTARTGTPE